MAASDFDWDGSSDPLLLEDLWILLFDPVCGAIPASVHDTWPLKIQNSDYFCGLSYFTRCSSYMYMYFHKYRVPDQGEIGSRLWSMTLRDYLLVVRRAKSDHHYCMVIDTLQISHAPPLGSEDDVAIRATMLDEQSLDRSCCCVAQFLISGHMKEIYKY